MKKEPRIHKSRCCIPCKNVLKCQGVFNPEMCIKFERRENKDNGTVYQQRQVDEED